MSNKQASTLHNLHTLAKYWISGIRLYIGIGIVVISAEVWWWAHAAYSGNVTYIRLQEAYAWISFGMLILALLIGPVCKLVAQLPGKALLFDARRLIGVGAAWFASLHVVVAYGAQFDFANPLSLPGLLPSNFKTAFLLGISALIILLAMALTSYDKAFHSMGKWWFRLHRLVYAAALLVLLHAFMIGVHATSIVPLAILMMLALILVTLHVCIALRFSTAKTARSRNSPTWRIITLIAVIVLLVAIANFGIQQYFNKSSGVLGGIEGMEMHH